METSVNWITVLLAGSSAFIVGGLWYGLIFAKVWQRLVGLKDEEIAKGTAKVFGGSFVLSFIMAANLAFFIGNNDGSFGLLAGLAAGLGWVAMALGVNYLFERRSFKLYLINASYNVVTFALMGFIIGAL